MEAPSSSGPEVPVLRRMSASEHSFAVSPGEMRQVSFVPATVGAGEGALLCFRARIEATTYTCGECILGLQLNDVVVGERFEAPLRLVNKPPELVCDSTVGTSAWFTPSRPGWNVAFGPDFDGDAVRNGNDCTFRMDVTDLVRSDRANVLDLTHTKRFLANVLDTAARLFVEDLELRVVRAADVEAARRAVSPPVTREIAPARNAIPAHEAPVEQAFYSLWHGKQRERAPQIVFDDLADWELVKYNGVEASVTLSREKKLFSEITAKLSYRATGERQYVDLRPERPLEIRAPFDAVDLWLYEDCDRWQPAQLREPDAEMLVLLLRDAQGRAFGVDFGPTYAAYWFLRHGVIRPGAGKWWSQEPGAKPEAPISLTGLRIGPCTNRRTRSMYLDSLAFYIEDRPARSLGGEAMQPGKVQSECAASDEGAASGQERNSLTDEPPCQILPTPAQAYENRIDRDGDAFVLTCAGAEGQLTFRYAPRTGTFSDVTAKFSDGNKFHPMAGGGLCFEADGMDLGPGHARVKADLRDAEVHGDAALVRWRYTVGPAVTDAEFVFAIRGRTLVIDVRCSGDPTTGLLWGAVQGLRNPRSVFVPHLALSQQMARSVAPVCAQGLFVLGMLDWYVSDASELTSKPGVRPDGTAAYNTGCVYRALTDGRRRPLRERMCLSVSPQIEEVLPNTPNPCSPNRDRLAPYMYSVDVKLGRALKAHVQDDPGLGLALRPQMHGRLREYGLGPFIDMMHAPLWWRRKGEGFDMRARPRPEISDERLRAYTDFLHSLGNLAGMLTEYNDYDPANVHFRSENVCLAQDGTWEFAWTGCYAAKLSAGRRIARRVAPELKRKYGTDIVYFDTHTNLGLFARDYEAGVPGSGTARERFLQNTELIRECRAVHGALTSEGMQRWLYAGYTDMDFGYVLHPFPSRLPLLPVFDLLKIHPRQHGVAVMTLTDRRMGEELCWPQPEGCHRFEQYLANIIAYGHMGNICGWLAWRLDGLIKYWAMLYDLQREYLTDTVAEMKWHDGRRWLSTSEAVHMGAYRLGRFYVRYSRGLEIWVHYHEVREDGAVHTEETWPVTAHGRRYELPRYGWLAVKPGAGDQPELLEYHALVDGRRVDYVEGPSVIYADARGGRADFPAVRLEGAVLVRREGKRAAAVVPCGDLGDLRWRRTKEAPWDDDDVLEMHPAVNRGCGPIALRLDALFGTEAGAARLLAVRGEARAPYRCTVQNGWLEFQPDTETAKYILEMDE